MIKNMEIKRGMQKKTVYVAILMLSFLLVAIQPAVAQDDPLLEEELQMPGTVEGTGTYFEVTDSEYLNITLESSEPVTVMLESVPEMVVLDLEAAEGATSTQVTLTGFAPSTTYYKYEDDYHNLVTFTTDETGVYTYTQDLATPHLVFIQPNPSTLFIWYDGPGGTGGDASSIGTWDPATKTCTLGMDVTETIQIDDDGITLDGNGYWSTGPGSGIGVYIPAGRTGITIQNMDVFNFSYGIHLYGALGNTLANNVTNSNDWGIVLRYSGETTLTGNTANSNTYQGITLNRSGSNVLTGNTAEYNGRRHGNGIFLMRSGSNVLTGNMISNNIGGGITVSTSTGNQIYNNNFIDNPRHMWAVYSHSNVYNLPKPVGGNYYSDWTTPDADGDGSVDYPYVFQGGQDDLPWTVPNGWSDTTPPALSVTVSPDSLWPANHKLVPVACALTVTDDTDPNPVVALVRLGCNEYDNAIGVGDGNTHGDMDAADGDLTVDDTEFLLRAERAGSGDGRFYTITYRATDASGNSTEATAVVFVPKDQSSHSCDSADCDLNTW